MSNKQILVKYWTGLNDADKKKLCSDLERKESYIKSVFFMFNKPSLALCLKIQSVTYGIVTKEQLRPDIDW